MSLVKNLNIIATTAVLALAALPAHAGWQQTFADEFNGTSLDTSVWKYSDYFGIESNIAQGDQQCYKAANVSVANGSLSLQARREFPPGCNPDPGILEYTSGQISTGFTFSQQFGYFEVRAKLPAGKGLHSVFRLAVPGGPFPPLPPEIRVAELNGGNPVQALLEYDYIANNSVQTASSVYNTTDLSTDFHTYGVDWQPGKLIWYVDGVERARYENSAVTESSLYPILQLAVGNNKVGSPDASTVFPSDMQVDYIRIYRRIADGNPDTLPPGAVNPDSQAPSLTITAPASLARIVGDGKKFTVKANASDNIAVSKVEFYFDSIGVCTDTAAPYECQMTAPLLGKKELLRGARLTVKAYDAAGNVTTKTRDIVIVNVKNK